jgi:hypothetical protein
MEERNSTNHKKELLLNTKIKFGELKNMLHIW